MQLMQFICYPKVLKKVINMYKTLKIYQLSINILMVRHIKE